MTFLEKSTIFISALLHGTAQFGRWNNSVHSEHNFAKSACSRVANDSPLMKNLSLVAASTASRADRMNRCAVAFASPCSTVAYDGNVMRGW